MSRAPRYGRNQDGNHREIVRALEAVGATVEPLVADQPGVPDLLVGWRKQTFLLEVKDGSKKPSARRLRKGQALWHTRWAGRPVAVVHDVQQALAAIGATVRTG